MDKLTKEEFDEAIKLNKYWEKRWDYISTVLDLIENEKEVLEIGSGGLQLVKSSDTMDIQKPATYVQNASKKWNIEKKYDLIIALQVWEHLDNPRIAFTQAKQHAKKIILSFPIDWNSPHDTQHHRISRQEIIRWTELPKKEIRINGENGLDRLICIYC